jgi:hypothetical protein
MAFKRAIRKFLNMSVVHALMIPHQFPFFARKNVPFTNYNAALLSYQKVQFSSVQFSSVQFSSVFEGFLPLKMAAGAAEVFCVTVS